MTEKQSLQLAPVLPGAPDERDSCIQRLTDNLIAQGLAKVQVVQQDGKSFCARTMDPTLTARPQVRSLAQGSLIERGCAHVGSCTVLDCT